MKKYRICLILFIFICFVFAAPASAHSGNIDANGGHYDNETGEYHYHHGYPAHEHINGICPYNHDDQTKHQEGTSSYSTSTKKPELHLETPDPHPAVITTLLPKPIPRHSSTSNSLKINSELIGNIIFGLFIFFFTPLGWVVIYLVYIFIQSVFDCIQKRITFKSRILDDIINTDKKLTAAANDIITYKEALKYIQKHIKNIDNIIPDGVHIDDNMELQGKFNGAYTVYSSYYGKVIHKVRGCSNAYAPSNIVHVAYMRPCKLCFRDKFKMVSPNKLRNIIDDANSDWYHNYADTKKKLLKWKAAYQRKLSDISKLHEELSGKLKDDTRKYSEHKNKLSKSKRLHSKVENVENILLKPHIKCNYTFFSHTCSKCGHSFKVKYNKPENQSVLPKLSVICPECLSKETFIYKKIL